MAFTKQDDINIIQNTDAEYFGAGLGNDIYIINNGLLSENKEVSITDGNGNNTVRLIEGLSVKSIVLSSTYITLVFDNASKVTIMGADKFTFHVGCDAFGKGGETQNFEQLVTNILGLDSIPTAEKEIINSDGSSIGINSNADTHFTTFTLVEIPSQFNGYLWKGVDIPAILEGLTELTLGDESGDLDWYKDLYGNLLNNYQVWSKPKPILTPTESNEGVLEDGFTTGADEIIQGDTFALNGAYVDAGGGTDTLIVDMKGPFAQPARLANIETIVVQNMPNVYSEKGEDIYPNDPVNNVDAFLAASSESMLDLSRALDVKTVIATESLTGDTGGLTILNIQNSANLRMEGRFDSGVTFHYGYNSPAEVNLELYAVNSNNDVKIAHDAYRVKINSIGGQNVLNHANLGQNLANLVIIGDARFVVKDAMDNFADYGKANIDASANTGGVVIAVADHENVKFTGTKTNDQFGVSGDDDDSKTLIDINTGMGIDKVVLASSPVYVPDTTKPIKDVDGNPVLDGQGNPTYEQKIDHYNGVIALPSSKIDGNNVTLHVQEKSDIVDATLVGITSVVLEDELTISQSQFTQLGSSVFSGYHDAEGFLNIEITQNATLSSLATLANLSDEVNLKFDIKEGATLTMTAYELHNYVAEGGVVSGAGKLIITNAGLNFDPFKANDLYPGGTLDKTFKEWVNLKIERSSVLDSNPNDDINAFERPGSSIPSDTLTINSGDKITDEAGVVTLPPDFVVDKAIKSEVKTLEIEGDGNVRFEQTVDLGTPFVLNFSGLNAKLLGAKTKTGSDDYMTIANFEDVGMVIGNNKDARINVGIGGQIGKQGNENGLKSSGVATYVVTDIHDVDSGVAIQDFYVCDNTKDLKTLGLRGNAGDTINFKQVKWDVSFLLEGDGFVNWDELSKADFNPDQSNIGTLHAEIVHSAPAVVNINNQGVDLGKTSTNAPRPIYVDGIEIYNAASIALDIKDGNAVIKDIDGGIINPDGTALENGGNMLKSLTIKSERIVTAEGTVKAEGTVTVEEALPTTLTSINAAAVSGVFTATLDNMDDKFTLTASDNGLHLTLNGGEDGFNAAAGTVIDGGAGEDCLVIKGSVNLAGAEVSDIDDVKMTQDSAVTLTAAQIANIGVENITVDAIDHTATLNVANLGEGAFSILDKDGKPITSPGINLGTITIAAGLDSDTDGKLDDYTISLNADTNLTGADSIFVPKGTVLELTAAQFNQLDGKLTNEGKVTIEGEGKVNITGLTQADIDAGFDLSGVKAVNGTITLGNAEVVVKVDSVLGNFAIDLAEGQHIKLLTDAQAHGRTITGAANTTVTFLFPFDGPNGIDTGIDWNNDGNIDHDSEGGINTANYSGVTTLKVLETLVEGRNVEQVLANLDSSIVVDVIVTDDDAPVDTTKRIVVVEPGVTVDGGLLFDDLHGNAEVETLDLTLMGGVKVAGAIDISEAQLAVNGAGFQTLTIKSQGEAANVMGDISAANNNLSDINIDADQALTIGTITFSSLTDDKAATLNIDGDADVVIGALIDDADDNVETLAVVNDGNGNVTLTLNDATTNALSAIDGNGAADAGTGGVNLIINGKIDLSSAALDGIKSVVMDDNSELTLTAAQIGEIGAANFSVPNDAEGQQILNINALNETKFDTTALAAGIEIGTATIEMQADKDIALDPATNLTGVDKIVVPEGTTLTMTAAQFQQLDGHGVIKASDTNGDGVVTPITVNITGLTQADVDKDASAADTSVGLNLSGIENAKGTITLAESVILKANIGKDHLTVLGAAGENGFAITLTEGQSITLSTDDQAHGRVITGAANTKVAFAFPIGNVDTEVNFDGDIRTGIDTANYKSVSTLEVLNTLVTDQNVEQILANLKSTTVVSVVTEKEMPGAIADTTNRVVVVEPNVTVNGGLLFDDLHFNTEVANLDLTLSGSSKITGTLDIEDAVQANGGVGFTALTINSEGEGDDAANEMGDIKASNNNLLNITINAAQDLAIGSTKTSGTVTFTSLTEKAAASLTIGKDSTNDVTIKQLDVQDADIITFNAANNAKDTTLHVTGASPAFVGNVEDLNLSGAGNIILGSRVETKADTWADPEKPEYDIYAGIDDANLSKLDASKLTGSLDIVEIDDVDSSEFTFTSGSGATTLTLNGEDFLKAEGEWKFDLSNAGAGSIFNIMDNGNAFANKGTLDINLGSNAGIVIKGEGTVVDLRPLGLKTTDTTFGLKITDATPASTIVVEEGATLRLTADQAKALGAGISGSGVEIDGRNLNYSNDVINESEASDGSITETLTLTLEGTTFAGPAGFASPAGTDLSQYVTNVPIGLTAKLIVGSSTTATLSFTGKAVAHAADNDVDNVTISLPPNVFADNIAVTGGTTNDLKINFTYPDAGFFTYNPNNRTLHEAAANDGSVTETLTLTLEDDTFTSTFSGADLAQYVKNVPTGLIVSLKIDSATKATLSFTGKALHHEDVNDESNITLNLPATAFAKGVAAEAEKITVDFRDVDPGTLSYSGYSFTEAAANDGTLADTKIILTLTGDTFKAAVGSDLGKYVQHVPAGLIASLKIDTDKTATLTLTGKAPAHADANDEDHLLVSIPASEFAKGVAAVNAVQELTVDFNDPAAYKLAAAAEKVDEGQTAEFTLTTTNVPAGTELAYTISGVVPSDIDGTLTGKAIVEADGTTTIKVAIAPDAMTEAVQDTLTVTLDDHKEAAASILINDTSLDPTYKLVVADGAASVDEGATAHFVLTTTDVKAGAELAYTITGVQAADIASNSLIGKAVVEADGTTAIDIAILADHHIDGPETLTITFDNSKVEANILINDTSAVIPVNFSGAVYNAVDGAEEITINAPEVWISNLTINNFNPAEDTIIISGEWADAKAFTSDTESGQPGGTFYVDSDGKAHLVENTNFNELIIAGDGLTEGTTLTQAVEAGWISFNAVFVDGVYEAADGTVDTIAIGTTTWSADGLTVNGFNPAEGDVVAIDGWANAEEFIKAHEGTGEAGCFGVDKAAGNSIIYDDEYNSITLAGFSDPAVTTLTQAVDAGWITFI